MVTIRAPYPSKMDAIHNQSVVSLERPGAGDIAVFSNRSGVVESFQIRNNPAKMPKVLRRIGSWEVDPRDIIVKDWCRPYTLTSKVPNVPLLQVGFASYAQSVSWSPDGVFLSVGHSLSPFMTTYRRSGDTFTNVPATNGLPSAPVFGLDWNMNGDCLYTSSNDKTCRIYSRAFGDLFNLLSGVNVFNPVPSTYIQRIKFTKDGTYVAVAAPLSTAGAMVIYKRATPSGFLYNAIAGTNVENTNLSNVSDIDWTQNGQYLAFCDSSADSGGQRLFIYKRSGDVFTKLVGQPVGAPSFFAFSVAFSLDDNYLAVSYSQSGASISIYKRTGDTFNLVTATTPAQQPDSNRVYSMKWTPDGKYLMMLTNESPFTAAYKFENETLTKITIFPTLLGPGARYREMAFSPDGVYLAVASRESPYLEVWKSALGPISGPYLRSDPTSPVLNYPSSA